MERAGVHFMLNPKYYRNNEILLENLLKIYQSL
jgi:hypothetical protein